MHPHFTQECGIPPVHQIQNPFLTAQSTQIKSVISVPPDIALCTEDLHRIIEREVGNQLGGSDHRPVYLTIAEKTVSAPVNPAGDVDTICTTVCQTTLTDPPRVGCIVWSPSTGIISSVHHVQYLCWYKFLMEYVRKLAYSKWGTSASTIRTTALALCYSVAEYAAPVWVRSHHAHILDSELHAEQ